MRKRSYGYLEMDIVDLEVKSVSQLAIVGGMLQRLLKLIFGDFFDKL